MSTEPDRYMLCMKTLFRVEESMTNLLRWTFLSLLCGAAVFGQAPSQSAVTVMRAGTLIDGRSSQPKHDQVIIIRGNRIESVSDADSAKVPQDASVIDLSKETVLPGLIDSHTHIFLQGEDPAQGGYDANILNP